jgi:hypothetical protein
MGFQAEDVFVTLGVKPHGQHTGIIGSNLCSRIGPDSRQKRSCWSPSIRFIAPQQA